MGGTALNGALPLAAALGAALNGRLDAPRCAVPASVRLPESGEEPALIFMCAGALWRRLHDVLERPALQSRLICADVIGYGGEREQAASDWFECVMMRPLTGRPSGTPGRSHRLAALLFQRALHPDAPHACIIRDETGLSCAGHALPDAMSVWEALRLAPQVMYRLRDHGADGAPSRYRNLLQEIVRTIEAANESWRWTVQLGLHPRDWAPTLSINAARSLVLFVNEVRRQAHEHGLHEDDARAWACAFKVRRPSGFGDVDALIASDIGRAVRLGLGRRRTSAMSPALEARLAAPLPDEAAPGPSEFSRVMGELALEGAISAFERHVLQAVFDGASLEDALAGAPEPPAGVGDPASFAEALGDRLMALAEACSDPQLS